MKRIGHPLINDWAMAQPLLGGEDLSPKGTSRSTVNWRRVGAACLYHIRRRHTGGDEFEADICDEDMKNACRPAAEGRWQVKNHGSASADHDKD